MKTFICINCPRGCMVEIDENLNCSGNQCIRGEEHAKQELLKPLRILTTTVKCNDPKYPRLSVKTSSAIPKDLIEDAMNVINQLVVNSPIHIGDVVIKDLLNLGVDVIATKEVD